MLHANKRQQLNQPQQHGFLSTCTRLSIFCPPLRCGVCGMPVGDTGTAFGTYLGEELQMEHSTPSVCMRSCSSHDMLCLHGWLTYCCNTIHCAEVNPPCGANTPLYPSLIQRLASAQQRASSVSMMAKPVQLPNEDSFGSFEEAVLKRELPVMVYFHAM